MEFKGTKGEWEIKHSESKDAFNIVGTIVGGHYKIARIPYLVTESLIEVNKREKSEAQANAKLIACAPELLEMVKILQDYLTDTLDEYGGESLEKRKSIIDANDLLKKATE